MKLNGNSNTILVDKYCCMSGRGEYTLWGQQSDGKRDQRGFHGNQREIGRENQEES